MKLSVELIRTIRSFEEMKPILKNIADNLSSIPYEDLVKYKFTIETQADKFGVSVKEINDFVEQYQIFGYES